jgi:hypothetical protein
MKPNKIIFFYLLLLLFNQLFANAQNSFDSSFADAVAVYKSTMGVNIHLFNGSEYINYDHRITGDPFFESVFFKNGSLVYDGILYTDVKMSYDILNDDLVITNYNGLPLLLTKEKIGSFNFAGHYFIKVVTDSTASAMKTGFYDVLHDGTTKLLARRKKEITEKISTQYSESFFTQRDQYYVVKDSVSYVVRDRRSALNIMKNRRNELSKFIHQNKIKFNKNFEAALLKTVAHYDSLNLAK